MDHPDAGGLQREGAGRVDAAARNGIAAGAGAIALLLATPSFAQSRGDGNRNNNNDRNGQTSARDNSNRSNGNNAYRENQRINETGKVTSFSRERDGYRVQLDRANHSFWVPQSTFGNRARDRLTAHV